MFTLVFDDIFFCFINLHFVQELRVWKNLKQWVPNEYCKIFCGANCVLKVGHIFVQVLVVEYFHDAEIHVLLQIREIHHHSCGLLYWSFDGHFNLRDIEKEMQRLDSMSTKPLKPLNFTSIVVSMAIYVVTFWVDGFIFFFWQKLTDRDMIRRFQHKITSADLPVESVASTKGFSSCKICYWSGSHFGNFVAMGLKQVPTKTRCHDWNLGKTWIEKCLQINKI